MKPSLDIEKNTVIQPRQQQKVMAGRYKLAAAFVAGLVILVTALNLGSVYFAELLCKREITALHDTLKRTDDAVTVTAVTVKEDFYYNQRHTIIRDHRSGLDVFKLAPDNRTYHENCYVVSFDMTKDDDPTHVTQRMDETRQYHYSMTNIWINSIVLGPKSANVCSGGHIFLLQEVTNDGLNNETKDVAASFCYWRSQCKLCVTMYDRKDI